MDLNPISSKKLVAEPVKCSIPEMDSFIYNLLNTFIDILFDHLPLEDFLHCNLVCRQWNDLYRAACARRRRLTLIIENPPKPNEKRLIKYLPYNLPSHYSFANWEDKLSPIRHSWLMRLHGKLDHSLVTGLMHNLVNITTLEIILAGIPLEALDQVTQLLHFWSQKLISLKLWFPNFDHRCEKHGNWCHGLDIFLTRFYTSNLYLPCIRETKDLHLINAINSLSMLTHLTLSYPEISICTKDSQKNPILRIQLENLLEFHWNLYFYDEIVCKAIFSYVQSHPNLHFGFEIRFEYIKQTDVLFSYDHQVASRITQLCLFIDQIDIISNESLLTRFSEHFSHITKLELFSNRYSIAQCARAVSRFSKLTHLKIGLELKNYHPDRLSPLTKEQITRFEAIKMLSIRLTNETHLDLQTSQLHWVFPNLKMIYISQILVGCTICGLGQQLQKLSDSCLKFLLSPLKECEHLKVIKYSTWESENFFFSKEDL